MESEKTALTKSLEEAKAAQDEAVAIATSLKFEQKRLIRVAKAEAKEKLAQTLSEMGQVVKALEQERANRKAAEDAIKNEAFDQAKQEVVADIVKFGMGFRCSALFMIRKKYLELDLFDVELILMEGHNVPDLADGSGP